MLTHRFNYVQGTYRTNLVFTKLFNFIRGLNYSSCHLTLYELKITNNPANDVTALQFYKVNMLLSVLSHLSVISAGISFGTYFLSRNRLLSYRKYL